MARLRAPRLPLVTVMAACAVLLGLLLAMPAAGPAVAQVAQVAQAPEAEGNPQPASVAAPEGGDGAVAVTAGETGARAEAAAPSGDDRIDYAAWEALAARAEAVLDTGHASEAALYALRRQIADWRQRFVAAREANQTRLRTVTNQLDALGPPPEDGNEAPEIAARRAALQAELERLRAPVVAAELAYKRADALVAEIDRVIRERRAEAFFTLGPSPLNPAYWPEALSAIRGSLDGIRREIVQPFGAQSARVTAVRNAPLTAFYLVLALVLLGRGRAWAGRLEAHLTGRGGAGRDAMAAWGTLFSLAGFLLPLAGLYALVEALYATELVGVRLTLLLDRVPRWGTEILLARWLLDRLSDPLLADGPHSPLRAAATGLYPAAMSLASVYVATDVLEHLISIDRYGPEAAAVLRAPLLAGTGLLLARIGLGLARAATADAAAAETTSSGDLRRTVLRNFGRLVAVVGAVGALLAIVGYQTAAQRMLMPAVSTLGLAAMVWILGRVMRAIFRALTGRSDEESLLPVMFDAVLVVGALPVLAMIWGAAPADLRELWLRLEEGFSVGGVTISPGEFLTFVLVFAIGYTATRVTQAALRGSVLPRTRLDPGARTAIVSGVGYLGIFLSALVAITTAGIDLSALALVAGALSVGIGFGLQNIVSNFVSGIILLIERPIAEGDWVDVGGKQGYVRDISVRSTRIETFDRTDVIVPNSEFISGVVTNYTRSSPLGRIKVPVGVAYGTDTRMVEALLKEIATAHPMVLLDPAPSVLFLGFGASSLDFEIRAIIRDINFMMSVTSELNHEIARRFAEAGIEIPFPQRDLWFRNPETLARAGAAQGAGPGERGGAHADSGAGDRPGGGAGETGAER